MKIELRRIDSKTVGWSIIAESIDDKLVLGSIRDKEFWGYEDTRIIYDGMKLDPDDRNYVKELKYVTKRQSILDRESFMDAILSKD